jgi:molybdenum cofactor cytidylyltransferase
MAAPVGILLCAGRGRRFDPTGLQNKLLHRLDNGEAVVVASAKHLLAALPKVIAVVRADEGSLAKSLRELGCTVTVCQDAATGMSASLKHAIKESLPDAQSWIVALGDMPFVRPDTITALSAALANGAQIAVPMCEGRRGNPVGFGIDHLPALLALQGDQGGRGIVQANSVVEVVVADPGILRDIDTASDIQA